MTRERSARIRLLFAMVLALLGLFSPSARAQAADPQAPPVESSPRDAPLVLQPSAVKIPALPAGFQTRDAGWLLLEFPASLADRADPLYTEANDVKAHLSDELGQDVLDHVVVRLTRTPEEMASLAPADYPPPRYASGVAYPAMHLVLLTMQAPVGSESPDLDEVFRHELSHVALEDAVNGNHVPRWFTEGLAVHESGEHSMVRTHTLWDATLSRAVMPLSELDRGFPDDNRYEVSIAYAESADFLRFLLRSADRARFVSLVARVRAGSTFDRALADAYGTDLRRLEYEWREELTKRYGYVPVLTGGSIIWVGIVGLMGAGYWRKKRQARAKLAQWEAEERAIDAAVLATKQHANASVAPPPPEVDPTVVVKRAPNLPMVEHDGTWHTLH